VSAINKALRKVISWVIALLGLWEAGDIIAPFIPGFGTIQAAVWNHIVVGILLMITGAGAALTRNIGAARRMNWIAAAAGLWLTVATFIFRPQVFGAEHWNDLIVGVFALILGVWAALAASRAAG
jgi:hypothetical protein